MVELPPVTAETLFLYSLYNVNVQERLTNFPVSYLIWVTMNEANPNAADSELRIHSAGNGQSFVISHTISVLCACHKQTTYTTFYLSSSRLLAYSLLLSS